MLSFRRLSIIFTLVRVVAGADEHHQINVGIILYPEGITTNHQLVQSRYDHLGAPSGISD